MRTTGTAELVTEYRQRVTDRDETTAPALRHMRLLALIDELERRANAGDPTARVFFGK